jgi:single-strand DNA-binding protein
MITTIITGNVGRDAELREVSGSQVLNVAVAAESGRERTTIWFDCEIWGRRGEALAPHMIKGTKVTATGEMTLREHNGKVYHKLRVHDIALQGGRRDADAPAPAKRAAPKQGGGSFGDDAIPF